MAKTYEAAGSSLLKKKSEKSSLKTYKTTKTAKRQRKNSTKTAQRQHKVEAKEAKSKKQKAKKEREKEREKRIKQQTRDMPMPRITDSANPVASKRKSGSSENNLAFTKTKETAETTNTSAPNNFITQLRHTTSTTQETDMTQVNKSVGQGAESKRITREATDPSGDSSVAKFVDHLIDIAVEQRASDIHIEPFEQGHKIRLRIDGLLQAGPEPPKEFGSRLNSRIKVLGQLDISERRLPQDGRLRLDTANNKALDLRISSLPTLWGEKIVLRLLNIDTSHRGIQHLGLEDAQKQILLNTLKRPQGLILVTGPTGSGKTMTLYSALDLLNETQRNISTVEDPVEINVHGINQVNVNPRIGLDFATTLRALLRQDPDIIMVGEIRDLETANIAIRAAQTGHLVLSTLHTNSALATFERLIQMGVPRYNLTTSISLVVAQRLLRKLCPYCKEVENLPETIYHETGIDYPFLKKPTFKAHQHGCDHCNHGYMGRVGIFEFVKMDHRTIGLLNKSNDESPIMTGAANHRKEQNNEPMKEQQYEKRQKQVRETRNLRQIALSKVIQGVTSLQEANRLTLSDEPI